MDKINVLLENEGFEDLHDFVEEFVIENVVPGICMNENCEYTTYYEPDQDKGWCEFCHTNSVMSGLILMGIV